MPSGLIALLDDVAMIAKLASASMDDIAGATAKAGAKAAGVVIDDTAVTPRYVTGLTPDRELPIIARITVGRPRRSAVRNRSETAIAADANTSTNATRSKTVAMAGGRAKAARA